jgi:hypothetical protein
MKGRIATAAALIATLAGAQPSANRAPAVSVSLSPPFIEKLARPSGRLSDTIALTNGSLFPVDVSVDFADFRVSDRGEVEEMPPGVDPSSLASHLHITPLTLRVNPKQRAYFRYTVETPAEFRQLREQIFFTSVPVVPNAANQVVFVPRLGVPLYVENISAKPPAVHVDSVKWSRPSNDALELELDVRNDGERNIRPKGFVEVRSIRGTFSSTFPFNRGNEPLLPAQRRHWPLRFNPVPAGDLSVRLHFETSPRAAFDQQYRLAAF